MQKEDNRCGGNGLNEWRDGSESHARHRWTLIAPVAAALPGALVWAIQEWL